MISHFLRPQSGELVVDVCAGAGGKALHCAALMNNRGRIIAADVDLRRLHRLEERARRAGASIIEIAPQGRIPRSLGGSVDAVLVDAPCSGLGTLRRNPGTKVTFSEGSSEAYSEAQYTILLDSAPLVRPGGRLLYATCTLLRRENEDVVERFCAAHRDFTVVPVQQALACERAAGILWTVSGTHSPSARHRWILRSPPPAPGLIAFSSRFLYVGRTPCSRPGRRYISPRVTCLRISSDSLETSCMMMRDLVFVVTVGVVLLGCSKTPPEEMLATAIQEESQARQAADTVLDAGLRAPLFGSAVAAYQELLEAHPSSPQAQEGMFRLATIYNNDIRDFPKAVATYRSYSRAVPERGKNGCGDVSDRLCIPQ